MPLTAIGPAASTPTATEVTPWAIEVPAAPRSDGRDDAEQRSESGADDRGNREGARRCQPVKASLAVWVSGVWCTNRPPAGSRSTLRQER